MPIDSERFKAGMRHLAGHVCLVTTANAAGERNGLTATAVCSVSAEPPLLLCCVNREAQSHDAIHRNGVFAINVLAVADRALAERFAGPIGGDARFDVGDWQCLETGAPVLGSALVSFDCRLYHAVDAGTHGIFFGEIQALRLREDPAAPLLYAHGNYGAFGLMPDSEPPGQLWMPPDEPRR